MPQEGYIALWRKSIDSGIFQNEGLWKLWCLCLMKANHKKVWFPIDGILEPVQLLPGQFITGRFSLHKEYYGKRKKQKTPLTLWRWMQTLEKMGNLNIKTNNKYSIITIINWDSYQNTKKHNEQQNEQQMNNKRTTDEQQMNTDNNDNNVNNDNKKKSNKRKILLPDNYKLTEELIKYANDKNILNGIADIFEGFCIYHRQHGSKFVSWDAAWKTWIRNKIKWDKEKNLNQQEPNGYQPPLEEILA